MKRIFTAVCLLLLSYSIALGEGNISVIIRYEGIPPKLEPLKVTKDEEFCGKTVPNESLIVGPNDGIRNAIVYLKGVKGEIKENQFILKNEKCRFFPHVGFAPEGGELLISNEDNVLHNTHAYIIKEKMRRTALNIGLPHKGDKIINKRVFMRPGLIKVECDAHEWMLAWIIVIDHPYAAVTDENGKAEINNVPDGEHEIVVFHETLGEYTKKIKVEAGKITTVEFKIK